MCSARARRCRAQYDVLFIPQLVTFFFVPFLCWLVLLLLLVVVVVGVVVVAVVQRNSYFVARSPLLSAGVGGYEEWRVMPTAS